MLAPRMVTPPPPLPYAVWQAVLQGSHTCLPGTFIVSNTNRPSSLMWSQRALWADLKPDEEPIFLAGITFLTLAMALYVPFLLVTMALYVSFLWKAGWWSRLKDLGMQWLWFNSWLRIQEIMWLGDVFVLCLHHKFPDNKFYRTRKWIIVHIFCVLWKDSRLWPSLLKPNNNLREKLRKQYLWAVGSLRQIVNNGGDQLQLNGINGNFRGKKINTVLIRTGSEEPQYCEWQLCWDIILMVGISTLNN